jgi:hypothetical protein
LYPAFFIFILMKKLLLFFFVNIPHLLNGQQPVTYVDSAKNFLNEWNFGQTENPLVLDNTSFLSFRIDSAILESFMREEYNQPYWKVYKMQMDTIKHYRIAIDSIVIEPIEKNYIITKLKMPAVKKWTDEFLKSAKFASKQNIDSQNLNCNSLLERQYERLEYREKRAEYGAFKKDSIYNYYETAARESTFYKHGYWKVCPPIFIKNGDYCIFLYEHVHGCRKFYVAYDLGVYRREKEHWKYYGDVIGGSIN